jgi:hypothetical protein
MLISETGPDIDKSGVTSPPFQGEKQRTVSLTGCKVELRFQDARAFTCVSLLGTDSLGLSSIPRLFLTVSEVKFKDAELCQLQGQILIFRTR